MKKTIGTFRTVILSIVVMLIFSALLSCDTEPGAILNITFDPNPVELYWYGEWRYTVIIEETGGFDVTISGFSITRDDTDSGEEIQSWAYDAQDFEDWFGVTTIAALSRREATFISTGFVPYKEEWRFVGTDQNGSVVGTGKVTLLQQ